MERDTVHLCMFLAYLFVGFVNSDYVHQGDRNTYVSITGIDNVSCFNAGIDNPCERFTYVLENINSCDDNCAIIIVDSLPRVINSTINVLPRKNQSLHVSSFDKVTVNFSIGDVRISSSGHQMCHLRISHCLLEA